MQGKRADPALRVLYQRTFGIPNVFNAVSGMRLKRWCNGVYSFADAAVNNNHVGSHLEGFNPFRLDITSALAASSAGSNNSALT